MITVQQFETLVSEEVGLTDVVLSADTKLMDHDIDSLMIISIIYRIEEETGMEFEQEEFPYFETMGEFVGELQSRGMISR